MAEEVVTAYLMDRAGPDANAFGEKLAGREGVALLGGADDVDDALTELGELAPDVVLVSTDFGGAGCVNAVEALLAVNPQATVVMLSSRGDKALVHAGMRAGATGSLDRNASPGESITALHVRRRQHLGEDIDLALAEPEADMPMLRVSGKLPVFPGGVSAPPEPGVEATALTRGDEESLRAQHEVAPPDSKRRFRLFGRRKQKSQDWGPAAAGASANGRPLKAGKVPAASSREALEAMLRRDAESQRRQTEEDKES